MAIKKLGSSISWLLLGRIAQVSTQLVGIAILARLIPPSDFGLMALAGVVMTLLQIFSDMGVSSAIIQKKDLDADLKNSAFWLNLLISAILFIILILASPLVSEHLGNANTTVVLQALAITFPLNAAAAIQIALLERDSKFREISLINIFASCVGLSTAILLAFKNFGVLSLVAQSLATATFQFIFLWCISSWRPSTPSIHSIKKIFFFSRDVFLFNLINYFHRSSDIYIIGRLFGSADLGIYNTAYRLVLLPLQNITFAINRALLPAYSQQQHAIAQIRTHYLLTLRCISLITAPLMTFLWVMRDPIVHIFLGKAWTESIEIIKWLALVGYLQSITSTVGAVLIALGHTRKLRILGFIGAPFLTASFFFGLPWGLQGIAACYCIANLIWSLPVLHAVMRSLNGKAMMAILAILPSAIVSIMAFLFALSIANHSNTSELSKILLVAFIGSSIYAMIVIVFLKDSIREMIKAIRNKSS